MRQCTSVTDRQTDWHHGISAMYILHLALKMHNTSLQKTSDEVPCGYYCCVIGNQMVKLMVSA